MNRSLFSKRYRFLTLILTILMLVSVVSPTFATGNKTITYSVGVQARCLLSSHPSSHSSLYGTKTYGGSSVTYTVNFGATATVETGSSWKQSSSAVLSTGGASALATVPANNVSIQRISVNRGTNPIFSGASGGSTFISSTTTSFATPTGAASTAGLVGTLTFNHPPTNKLTAEVVFKNNTTNQLIYRTVTIEGMPTTCTSSTPVYNGISNTEPKKHW